MESYLEELTKFFNFLRFLITILSWEQIGLFIAGFFMFFGAFYILLFSPIIFNFFLVPGIEKKIGQRIGYLAIDRYIWLGNWMNRQTETAIYIINCYKDWKLLPKYYNQLPLKKVGYNIDLISKTEVIFSFLLITVMIITVISSIIGFVLAGISEQQLHMH